MCAAASSPGSPLSTMPYTASAYDVTDESPCSTDIATRRHASTGSSVGRAKYAAEADARLSTRVAATIFGSSASRQRGEALGADARRVAASRAESSAEASASRRVRRDLGADEREGLERAIDGGAVRAPGHARVDLRLARAELIEGRRAPCLHLARRSRERRRQAPERYAASAAPACSASARS